MIDVAYASSPDIRAHVIRAAEAIVDGELQLAYDILQGVQFDLDPPAPLQPKLRCRLCGVDFRWPGERETHVQFVHAVYEGWQA